MSRFILYDSLELCGMKILVRNATVINPDSRKESVNILIENGKITSLGGNTTEADEIIDATIKSV